MMQGGGGSEVLCSGQLPVPLAEARGLKPRVANGYAIASQDAGHETTDLLNCKNTNANTFGNVNEYALDSAGSNWSGLSIN